MPGYRHFVLQPVGPLNPKVYWARRVALMTLAVVVLIGVVWLVRGSGGSNTPTTLPAGDVGGSSTGVTPTTGASPQLTGELPPKAPASLTGELATTTPSAGSDTATTTSVQESIAGTGTNTAPTTVAETAAPGGTAKPSSTSTSALPTDPEELKAAELQAEKERQARLKEAQQEAERVAKEAEDKVRELRKKLAAEAAAEKAAAEKAARERAAAEAAALELASRKYDAQGQLICPTHFIQLTAQVSAESFPVGTKPTLTLTVKNVGDLPCVQDVSGTAQHFDVRTKSGDHVWSTDDCFPGQGNELRVLQPGDVVDYATLWAGTTSAPGCSGERVQVPAGSYLAQVRLGELKSKEVAFKVTAAQ